MTMQSDTHKNLTASTTTPITVITTCYGRNEHLYNLLASLAHSSVVPDEVIIVNDDADPERLANYPLNIVKIPTTAIHDTHQSADSHQKAFDIGHNRNLGAAFASHESLIFLDVDCIVAPTCIEQLSAKLKRYPKALLMGQPRYLTQPLSPAQSDKLHADQLTVAELDEISVYNPYRYNFSAIESVPNPQTALIKTEDYGAFWSLCFAIHRIQFDKIGGFDTRYTGYGAEDTDFAFTARTHGIDFYLCADVVYHQQHTVYRPPLNHLASIVTNANHFYDKWQHWPMGGWLSDFETMQLIDWQDEQSIPIAIKRIPNEDELRDAYHPDAPYV